MNLIFLFFEGFWMFLIPAMAAVLGYLLSGKWKSKETFDIEEKKKLSSKIKTLENEIMQLKQRNLEIEERTNELLKLQQDNTRVASPPVVREKFITSETIQEPNQSVDQSTKAEGPSSRTEERKKTKYDALKNDNLQIIEGVGPKMESVLKENGISDWQSLGAQTEKTLQTILEKYGTKYKIIDPSSWAEQASLAAVGGWPQLVRMQQGLDPNRLLDNNVVSKAKVEKVMIKLGIIKEYKQDDLKAIEGIGPKIAELLSSADINTWKELASTDNHTLQSILDQGGKRYQLADPSTWATQAALANDGRFEELTDYQERLVEGE